MTVGNIEAKIKIASSHTSEGKPCNKQAKLEGRTATKTGSTFPPQTAIVANIASFLPLDEAARARRIASPWKNPKYVPIAFKGRENEIANAAIRDHFDGGDLKVPSFLRSIGHLVKTLDLSKLWISSSLLNTLSVYFPKLETLILQDSHTYDSWLEPLKKFTSLKCIDLSRTKITGTCLSSLPASLEELKISDCESV